MRAERLPVTELDDVAGRVLYRAEIAGRRRILARLPVKTIFFSRALGDPRLLLDRAPDSLDLLLARLRVGQHAQLRNRVIAAGQQRVVQDFDNRRLIQELAAIYHDEGL